MGKTKNSLQEIDEELGQFKYTLFDYPKEFGFPLGETWWADQTKDLFKFTCRLVKTLHALASKIENANNVK